MWKEEREKALVRLSEGDPLRYEKIKYGAVEIYLAVLLSLKKDPL